MTPWFARTAEMAAIFMVGDGLIGLAQPRRHVDLWKDEALGAEKAVAPLTRVLALCEKKEGFRFDYTRARANFLMGRALLAQRHPSAKGRALVRQAREALVGFGAERFHRDLAEIDAWLAAQTPIR